MLLLEDTQINNTFLDTTPQEIIFFRVIGRVFDGLKEDALRVRDETNVATASPIMLPIHGQDRNMPRLAGEDVEVYRTRLAMKGIIAEKGGLKEGILYVLAALGYENAHIEPVGPQDPERWAEFIVDLGVCNAKAVRDIVKVYNEIQAVKEGSSKVAGFIITNETLYLPLPITPHLAPRMSVSTLPRYRPAVPPVKLCPHPRLGPRATTVRLPKAADHEGG